MNPKLVIIGQAPSRGGDPRRPLEGPLGAKLCYLLGIGESTYLDRTIRLNLINEYPGKNGKGDKFDPRAARIAAQAVEPLLRGHYVVFLGWGVARAFRAGTLKPLEWHYGRGYVFAILPHPSGVNHWWNSGGNAHSACFFMEKVGKQLLAWRAPP